MQCFAIVILHELAHQWFGNLVTMKWWDDLWLNESFATIMSFFCLNGAEGLDWIQKGWTHFLGRYKSAGYNADMKNTTHPISNFCKHTDDGENMFDGISYGKGASVMRQLTHVIGEESIRAAMKIYFKRHAWQNTTLPNFIDVLVEGCEVTGRGEGFDLRSWTDSWLSKSGLNIYSPRIERDGETVTSIKIIQEMNEYGDDNILRE
jgi:aminopeptidase N